MRCVDCERRISDLWHHGRDLSTARRQKVCLSDLSMKSLGSYPLQALHVLEAFQLFDLDYRRSNLTPDFYSRSIGCEDSEGQQLGTHWCTTHQNWYSWLLASDSQSCLSKIQLRAATDHEIRRLLLIWQTLQDACFLSFLSQEAFALPGCFQVYSVTSSGSCPWCLNLELWE